MNFWTKVSGFRKPLIIADLANNHSGDIKLASDIIHELSYLQNKFDLKIVVKFQYRDLDSYIEGNFKGNTDFKFISRFESTRLEWNQFTELTNLAKEVGLLTAATPFDELSVEKVKEHGHDILKIASASSNDWNLLEKAVGQKMPMIVSLGGLDDYEVERVVSFLKHRAADFALMHCVALYPTHDKNLNLHKIGILKDKYNVITGYSTHENPKNYLAGPLAIASGAKILERHYAKEISGISINSYSSTKNEFEIWLESINQAQIQLFDDNFQNSLNEQKITLRQLKRGLYASMDIDQNSEVNYLNTYAAIPVQSEQLTSNDFSIRTKLLTKNKITKGSAIKYQDLIFQNTFEQIEKILSTTRTLINNAGLVLGPDKDVEISHHYGIKHFSEVGAILITIINREYAKKIVVMTKDQIHPEHFHKKKEETFIIMTGSLLVTLNGEDRILNSGDVLLIPRNSKHRMTALTDCVFEEISSTNFADDSFYSDTIINKNNRKTLVSLWF
jgi:sialic acid synthase SpsE/quercetin dioxygenase-like cupin family protein